MRLKVKIAILKSGKRQWQIAQEASINESRLSRYVQGHARLTDSECRRLAEILDLPIDQDRPPVGAPTSRGGRPTTRETAVHDLTGCPVSRPPVIEAGHG
jgi:hypothetical protein